MFARPKAVKAIFNCSLPSSPHPHIPARLLFPHACISCQLLYLNPSPPIPTPPLPPPQPSSASSLPSPLLPPHSPPSSSSIFSFHPHIVQKANNYLFIAKT